MPRTGGEADKFGNRYEGLWTVDSLLDIIVGDARSVLLEPLDGGLGIEFKKELNDGYIECHSVKRQTTDSGWSIANLTKPSPNSGRSILSDLFTHLRSDPKNFACFVSMSSAGDLEELRSIASSSSDLANFNAKLSAQSRLTGAFRRLSNLGNNEEIRLYLRRLRVIAITETELKRRVNQNIRQSIYASNGKLLDCDQVRTLLAEEILSRLGTRIEKTALLEFLSEHGMHERDWQHDPTTHELIKKQNSSYKRSVDENLIQRISIPRSEAQQAIDALSDNSAKTIAIIGAAGMGKSCVVSQVIENLESSKILYLVIRMDAEAIASTSQSFGQQFDLPMSPTITLAGYANGRKCVLVIDQLDAISTTSGRNQHLWAVFEELLFESRKYPLMHVILACRKFDSENDSRLRNLFAKDENYKIEISLLSVDLVKKTIATLGIDPSRYTTNDLELLRTPQNLSLFIEGDPTHHNQVIGSVQTLLDHYWDYKQELVDSRLGRASRWAEVTHTLSSWLSKHQTLSAPEDVLDSYVSDAKAMTSEHILVKDRRSYRFSHESIFDYAFARSYVRSGGTAMGLLESEEGKDQQLFRQSQVRQILTYTRDRDFDSYLTDLSSLPKTPKIRFHIKNLILDWLRILTHPRLEEWHLLQSLEVLPLYRERWRWVPHGSVAWFDLLLETATWQKWLRDPDDKIVDHAINLLGQTVILKKRADSVHALLIPYLDGSALWNRRFNDLLFFGEPHHSEEMFKMFIDSIHHDRMRAGQHAWSQYHNFPVKSPAHAAKILSAYAQNKLKKSFIGRSLGNSDLDDGFPSDFCSQLSTLSPEGYIDAILPIVKNEIDRPKDDSNQKDPFRRYLISGFEFDFEAQLIKNLGSSLELLAFSNPQRLRDLSCELANHPSVTLNYLILTAWIANETLFCDLIVDHLTKKIRASECYDRKLFGKAIKVVSRICSSKEHTALELSLLKYKNSREAPNKFGWNQLYLLKNLAKSRIDGVVKARISELNRKFLETQNNGNRNSERLTDRIIIPEESLNKIKIPQWINLLKKYQLYKLSPHSNRYQDSKYEIADALTRATRKNKLYLSKLLINLPDSIEPEFFRAILTGLVPSDGEAGHSPQSNGPDISYFVPAIRRVHHLPGKPYGASICDFIGKSVQHPIPDELIEYLSYYAVYDPDPVPLDESASNSQYGNYDDDILMTGINSVRGSAAWAISSILFACHDYWPKLKVAIESLCSDPSAAVKSCATRCLVALLNIDRDEAIEQFLILSEKNNDALAHGETDNFLSHACRTHYFKLRSLLLDMLLHSKKEARKIAGLHIALAAFSDEAAKEDLKVAMASEEYCRAGVAEVFAYNLKNSSVSDICGEKLIPLFSDPSKLVRDAASQCFRRLTDEAIQCHTELIAFYLDTEAFKDSPEHLILALRNSNALLPDIVCSIPSKIIGQCGESESSINVRRHAYFLPDLVLRIYSQTRDDSTRSRCLDAIDQLLEAGVSGMESTLRTVER